MNSNPVNPANQQQWSTALLAHLAIACCLGASVGYAVSQYFSTGFGIALGLTLPGALAFLVRVGSGSGYSLVARLGAWGGAVVIAIVTCSLSYATVYANLIAESSAMRWLERQQTEVLTKLQGVSSDSRTALASLDAWRDDAMTKQAREASVGGTCAAKSASTGVRGPIAMFREAEGGIASSLAAEFQGRSRALVDALVAAQQVKPTKFGEVRDAVDRLNKALEIGDGLTRGAFHSSAIEALQRQRDTTIRWSNGEQFQCGDAARDALIARALAAMTSLSKTSLPSQQQVAINLDDRGEVVTRGLLRGFNLALKAVSFGKLGSFADDPLMDDAIRKSGVVNRETLAFLISAILEAMLAITSWRARVAGHRPGTVNFREWRERASAAVASWRPSLRVFGHFALVLATIIAWPILVDAKPTTDGYSSSKSLQPARSIVIEDPLVPNREEQWGALLLPYVHHVNETAYLVIPVITQSLGARTIARCLGYNGLAELKREAMNLREIKNLPWLTRALETLHPNVSFYEVWSLADHYAQSLRLHAVGALRPV